MAVLNNFVDSIFAPVLQFLQLMIDRIGGIGTIAAKGVRLNDYFGFFSILGSAWTGVITSFLTALMFVFILYMVQKYSRVLLWLKDLIKWW